MIDELEYRKATDTSGYLMKDLWCKYTGVTETLIYQDTSCMWNECAPAESLSIDGGTYYLHRNSYCSGLTLEIFHRAMKKRDIDLGIAEEDEDWNGLGEKGSNAVTFAAAYKLDPRYALIFSQQYDMDYGDSIRSDVTLLRKYHRLNYGFTFTVDESIGDTSIAFSMWPEGIEELALGVGRYVGLGI